MRTAGAKHILLINPNTAAATTEMMLLAARSALPAGWLITGTQATAGAAMIVDEAGLAIAADEVIRLGCHARGCDAIIVAAFADPGIDALRAEVQVPVVGIGAAALQRAAALGRFGVATTTPGLVAAIETGLRRLGLAHRCTGIRLTGEDPTVLASHPDRQDLALVAAATRCIEQDGAQSVVIGGGPLTASAARLRSRFPTPIIEPIPAAVQDVIARLLS